LTFRLPSTFEQAPAKFVTENGRRRTIGDDIRRLSQLLSFIVQLALDRIHRSVLQPDRAAGESNPPPPPLGQLHS
jgi:hypothetical protein